MMQNRLQKVGGLDWFPLFQKIIAFHLSKYKNPLVPALSLEIVNHPS